MRTAAVPTQVDSEEILAEYGPDGPTPQWLADLAYWLLMPAVVYCKLMPCRRKASKV